MIALTVIFAAVNNLYPLVERRVPIIVFFFGLMHGFGFADVLTRLGLQESTLVTSLLGFNLGVEVGQIVIVALLFPILYRARTHRLYRTAGLGLGSSAIAVLGVLWFMERAFELGF